MSYIFPINPVPGDATVAANGATFVWDGAKWVGGMGGPYLPLAGGTMAGNLFLFTNPNLPMEAATKDYVDHVASQVDEAPMDGQSYGRMLQTWNPTLPITGGVMRGGINMGLWPIVNLRMPLLPSEAVNKEYVDDLVSTMQVYMGTWEVAANNPDLSNTTGLTNGAHYLAVTADPVVPETAPANIPGIGGQLIYNGSMIIWDQALGIYQVVQSGQLTKIEADLLYVAIAGSTMTGRLNLVGDPLTAMEAATKQYVDNEIANIPGGPGGGVPEAPATGQVYGRNGQTAGWVPVLTTTATIDGGVW